MLRNHTIEPKGSFIQQVKNYKTIPIESSEDKNVGSPATTKDKGKQKEIGAKIKEPTKAVQNQTTMSISNIELERKRKETEEVAKKLELAENESFIIEMNNKI